jgi:Cu+-exporting ATPase
MFPIVPFHFDWRIQAALAAIAVFGAGIGFFVRALRLARRLEAGMDTLVSLGAGTAFLFGVVEGLEGKHPSTFEGAAVLVAFILLGKWLEAKARRHATASLEALVKLAPSTARRVLADGSDEEVPVAALAVGDVVRVPHASAIPVDGIVRAGSAEVDEAVITGEPLPDSRGPGDAVVAGALVYGGSLDVEVVAAGRDTWLAKLANQVAEAQASKAPVQALVDRVSAYFVPAALALALATFLSWWWITGSIAEAWRPAVTLLVIACPCSLGLATPIALTTALGSAAKRGLLVRDAAAFERLAELTDLAFDKTGTLTQGRPALVDLRASEGVDPNAALATAAALERGSEHPIAVGIRNAAEGLALPEIDDFRAHTGGGVEGTIDRRVHRLGSPAFLGLDVPNVPEGKTAVGLVAPEGLVAWFVLADTPRPEAFAVVEGLRRDGLRLHLLSGDRPEAARAIGAKFGIEEALGGLRPEQKADRVRALRAEGRVVGFVGDGVNDAAALAEADAGISMEGLEAARVSAPLNLLRPGLSPLVGAIDLARRTRRVIRQNLAWAFGYNLVLVPLAALGELEAYGGPMLAGAAMGLSSLTVVLNALRLRG